MSTSQARFQVRFPADYDAQSEFETPMRGYLSGVVVEFAEGPKYEVFFYDPIRLRQDVEAEAALGRPYLAEPGMIVLPEVSTDAIHEAVEGLERQGFFQHLKPKNPLSAPVTTALS